MKTERKPRRWILPAVVLGALLAPVLLAVVAGLFAPRPVPRVEPIARPETRARPAATPSTTRPARPSPWKVASYYTEDGKPAKRLVCESATLGGRVEVTGGSARLVWTIVPTYPLPRVKQGVEWPLGVGRAPGGRSAELVELRRERWIIQGGRLVLELVDDKGETDLARGVALARALLALPEGDSACLPYPTADGKSWGLVLPLRGLRDALAQLDPRIITGI